jgi:hypothetical protein
LDVALDYARHGLAVFALPHGKKWDRRRWRQWQNEPPLTEELPLMFNGKPQNLAVICGRASGNLLVLEADDPVTFTETTTRLDGLGVETWTVQRPPNGSPHDGGGHVYLRTPEPVKSVKAGGLEVRGQGVYVLAPPSLHPRGGVYAFATRPPAIWSLPTMTALPWLPLTAAPDVEARGVPRLAWRLLRGDAETLARYHSRSEAEGALCASLARAGFTLADAIRLLRSHPGPGKFAELDASDPKNAIRYLALTWHSATAWLADHENEGGALAAQLRQWATSRPWPGRSGATDRAVYLAHLDIVARCGRDPHHASARDLAELAGVSWQTAANANHRLVDADLLELVMPATPTLAHVWRLCEHKLTLYHLTCDGVSTYATSHDLFRWQGVGKAGAEVLAALAAGVTSERDVAAATGRHVTTVRRKLRQLLGVALVEPLGDGYWRAVDDPDLDRAAIEWNVAGIGERQRVRHEKERQDNRLYLDWGLDVLDETR